VVATGANFCVGQDVSFQLQFTGLPTYAIATNFKWTLDGTFVNTNPPPQYSDGCHDYYVENPAFLNLPSTWGWWVSGGQPATYRSSVTCDLIFTNGIPSQPVNTSGEFTMYRPQIYQSASQSPGIVLTNGGILTSPSFSFLAFIHSAFNGQAGTTQILNGYSTNSAGVGDNTANIWELDIYPFYPIYKNGPTTVSVIAGADASNNPNYNWAGLGDDPSIPCSGTTVIHKDFRDYVRFSPSGSGNIFVTLGTLNWHVYATAELGTNGYFLTSTNASADPTVSGSTDFPYWTHTDNP
jgi:hypothetical protein